jgi:hypothetical protein
MSANVATGTVKSVRYCGHDYTVRPGEVYGNKQAWCVFCGDEQVTRFTPTRVKAVARIHEHAAESGAFPSQLGDGMPYEAMKAAVLR